MQTQPTSETKKNSETIDLTMQLIKRPSISPEDAGCQEILIDRLSKIGFDVERLKFGSTSNFWATHGSGAPILAFLGHTDVVPTGPWEEWQSPPFEPRIKDGHLYGRGAADMKSGIAAFLTAVERFLKAGNNEHKGTIAFIITSDEEASAVDGTIKVIEHLSNKGIRIDYGLVGEPSSQHTVGDTIKNGRRGSLTCALKIIGQQGHVAYPEKADNPIHKAMKALDELVSTRWDEGDQFFPPTSLQISNINGGTGADNVIPGSMDVLFNFRFSTEQTEAILKQKVHEILDRHKLNYEAKWRLSGHPFLTSQGKLLETIMAATREVTGKEPRPSTEGGTSDGRFLAPTGAEVVELGVINATIHKVNENVSIADVDTLSAIYERILELIFAGQ